MVEITKEFWFEAAHYLPSVGPAHRCSRMHGHLFRVEVTVAGPLHPVFGWVMDFADLAKAGNEVISSLDHRVLNEICDIGVPTSENIARYIFEMLSRKVQGVVSVTVHENPFSRCTYRAQEPKHKLREAQLAVSSGDNVTVSAAHFLLSPPDRREPIHGHDYRVGATVFVPEQKAIEASTFLCIALSESVEDMMHRLLIPQRPAIGVLRQEEESIVLQIGREVLSLPARDCCLLPCVNTTTEAIAQIVVDRLAKRKEIETLEAKRIEVSVRESDTAKVCAIREFEQQ